jgi:hypothetical protein
VSGILRGCLDCSRLFPADSGWNRCEVHRRGHDKPHYYGSAASRGYDWSHRKLRQRVLREHLERFGLQCPGWLVPAHPVSNSRQLELDHILPVADGGAGSYENSQILCFKCNRRKGAQSSVSPAGEGRDDGRRHPDPPKPPDEPRVFIR